MCAIIKRTFLLKLCKCNILATHSKSGLQYWFGVESLALTKTWSHTKFMSVGTMVIELRFFKKKWKREETWDKMGKLLNFGKIFSIHVFTRYGGTTLHLWNSLCRESRYHAKGGESNIVQHGKQKTHRGEPGHKDIYACLHLVMWRELKLKPNAIDYSWSFVS